MATRGVFQLQKLQLYYCEWGGSSRAIRDFINSGRVIQWAKDHPQVNVEISVRSNRHPFVQGNYISGQPKQIDVKNQDLKFILSSMEYLKNSSGRKIVRLSKPIITQTPSIQGRWTPMLNIDADFKIKFVA